MFKLNDYIDEIENDFETICLRRDEDFFFRNFKNKEEMKEYLQNEKPQYLESLVKSLTPTTRSLVISIY